MPTATQPIVGTPSHFSFFLQDVASNETQTEALATPFSKRALYHFLRDTTDRSLPESSTIEDLKVHATRHGYRLFIA